MFYVYYIRSRLDFSLFLGVTRFPLVELEEHNKTKTGYIASKKPWELAHLEFFKVKEEALARVNELLLLEEKDRLLIKELISSDKNKLEFYYRMPPLDELE